MPCHPESRAAIGFLANTFQVNRTVLVYLLDLLVQKNSLQCEISHILRRCRFLYCGGAD
jgi:hypothetical protein